MTSPSNGGLIHSLSLRCCSGTICYERHSRHLSDGAFFSSFTFCLFQITIHLKFFKYRYKLGGFRCLTILWLNIFVTGPLRIVKLARLGFHSNCVRMWSKKIGVWVCLWLRLQHDQTPNPYISYCVSVSLSLSLSKRCNDDFNLVRVIEREVRPPSSHVINIKFLNNYYIYKQWVIFITIIMISMKFCWLFFFLLLPSRTTLSTGKIII